MSAPLDLFLIAGEPSGDRLGAALIAALREKIAPRELRVSGVGGALMAAEGLDSLFSMHELSVMGLVEVLPNIRRLARRIGETADAAGRSGAAALVTIDSPGFTMRVARRVRIARPEMPVIHYVAPSVWAWRPGRAKTMARHVDHVLALLPFEPPYMTAAGMSCDFVGHPVAERPVPGPEARAAFRARHGVAADAPMVVVLPGSRRMEVARLGPVFGEALGLLAPDHPGLTAVLPAAETVVAEARAAAARWPVATRVLAPEGAAAGAETEKFAAFAAADAALAASGTVTLELAATRCPQVIGYRLAPVTAFVAARLLTIESANLVNLLLRETAVPEFLQQYCTPAALAGVLHGLLSDPDKRRAQAEAADRAMAMLGRGGPPPSERAAESVLAALERRNRL